MKRAYATANVLDPTPPGYHIPYPPTSAVPVPTEPIRPLGAGTVYDDSFDPVFSKQMRIANKWWEPVGDGTLVVLAGSGYQIRDAQQGGLIIVMEDAQHKLTGSTESYLTPSRHGYVQVVDAVGERLTLRAEDGTLFYFDVPSRQWVSP